MDPCSSVSILSQRVAQQLHLVQSKQETILTGTGFSETRSRYVARIDLSSSSRSSPTHSTVVVILPTVSQYVPPRLDASYYCKHLQNITLADSDPTSSAPIDVIIGADLYGALLRSGVRRGSKHQPVAQKTTLGWIITGPIYAHCESNKVSIHHTTLDDININIRNFWEIEDIPLENELSPEDQSCETHFRETHRRDKDGTYTVRLPFKTDPMKQLGESRSGALRGLLVVEKRFQRDALFADAYQAFMSEYEALGHMTPVPKVDESQCITSFYIPHHAVYNRDNNKFRVVFNASRKSATGKSLNDCMATGPKLQSELPAIIIRWRQYQIALVTDISKMYRQIKLDSRDVDYQRILWRPDVSNSIRDYRLTTVTYGTTAAPFLALRVIKQLVLDEGNDFPLAVPVLQQQTYVDDCLFGADTAEKARETREQLIAILKRGGFHLHKWISNRKDLIPDTDSMVHGKIHGISVSDSETKRVLGLIWHPDSDAFEYRMNGIQVGTPTKRIILSVIASIFDPLGWIAPVVVAAKIFMQRMWAADCSWDDPLPPPLYNYWLSFSQSLKAIGRISIPRWTGNGSQHQLMELHGFADASECAYAAVVYLRVTPDSGSPRISLLIAKTKVAPLKTLSIPRLELCAAVLLSKVIKYVTDSLGVSVSTYCWSDSMVALEWIRQSPARWKTFVANRVSLIQRTTPSSIWRHVSTADNPADCASRGMPPAELAENVLWWRGPAWLQLTHDQWPLSDRGSQAEACFEARTVKVIHSVIINEPWDLQYKFSSWSRLLRVTAYVMRFVKNAKPAITRITVGRNLIREEIIEAKLFWLRSIQADCFPQEVRALRAERNVNRESVLASLSPFLDNDGLIRVQGRLSNSSVPAPAQHPIILRSHPLVHLMVEECHYQQLHGGPQLLLTRLRREFWIVRARPMIRKILARCVTCERERAAMATQLMGDLPPCRVNHGVRPFIHTGVDYAGPIMVRASSGRGHHAHKAYVAIFVCMATKAVHIEVVTSYSTAAFIASYHRFISRRGMPSDLYSDNGTTFQGADRELSASIRSAQRDPEFAATTAAQGVKWHFIPPSAPHFGGLWEAAVKSYKYHMRRCVGRQTLTLEEMSTLACHIEACMNSRPIMAASDDFEDYRALTSGHFLIGSPLTAPPEPSVMSFPDTRLSRWQVVQQIQEGFWRSWQHDYLTTLQQRPKWRTRQFLASPGRIVALRDSTAPPCKWLLGRITDCHPGNDGLVRVVTIRTASGSYKRPLTKLCFLPVDINETMDRPLITADGPNDAAARPTPLS